MPVMHGKEKEAASCGVPWEGGGPRVELVWSRDGGNHSLHPHSD